MQSKELHEGDWSSVCQLDDQLTQVGLQLVLALGQRQVPLRVGLICNLGWQRRYLQSFCLEVGDEQIVQVHEVRVALVDDPLVRGLVHAAGSAVVVALRAIERCAVHGAL